MPDNVYAELRRRAAVAGMSLSDLAREGLFRIARRPTLADFLDRAAAADGMTFAEAREAVAGGRPDT